MSEPSPDYKVKCPDCDTVVTKESKADAKSLVESHNKSRHNGDEVAHVVGKADPLIPFVEILDNTTQKREIRTARYTEDMYRVSCPDCEHAAVEDTVSDGKEAVKKHNEIHHNGNDVAGFVIEDVDGTAASREKPYMKLEDTPDSVEILAEISQKENIVTLPNLSTHMQSP